MASGTPCCHSPRQLHGDVEQRGLDERSTVQRSDFLAAMRRVAASVTVVTTDGAEGRHGATVSAFCSVSADPPTVLVCLRAASRIAEAVTRNGLFTVSVLPEDRAELARRFAGAFDSPDADRFAGVPLVHFPGFAPGIEGATVLACRFTHAIREATHLMCVGAVAGALPGAPSPLAYLDGAFCAVKPHAATGASS